MTKRPDLLNNKYAVGHEPLLHYFKKGQIPYNKGIGNGISWYKRNKERATKTRLLYKKLNPDKVKIAQHLAAKKLYDLKRKIVSDYKNKPCSDCGNFFPSYVMDLDHVRGQKVMSIGANVKSLKMEDLLSELEKCDVVCSNCHRLRTWITRKRLTAET